MLRFTYTLLKLVCNNMSRSSEPLDRVWIFRTSDEPEMHKQLSHCLLNYIRSQHNDLDGFRHNKHCFNNPVMFSQPVHIASCVGGIKSADLSLILSQFLHAKVATSRIWDMTIPWDMSIEICFWYGGSELYFVNFVHFYSLINDDD